MCSQTPVAAPDTRICAYGSLISASGRLVSAARAAATITAVIPTLVVMSHVSSWVRIVLIALLLYRNYGGDRLRAQPGAKQFAVDGFLGEVRRHPPAQSGHLPGAVGADAPDVAGHGFWLAHLMSHPTEPVRCARR